MKYFMTNEQRIAAGITNCVEFQRQNAKDEYWDEASVYISYEMWENTGLRELFDDLLLRDVLFDLDTINSEDWEKITIEALRIGGTIAEAILELQPWMLAAFTAGYVTTNMLAERSR